MKRRDVLKGLSGVAGATVLTTNGLLPLSMAGEVARPIPLAMPIRGIVRGTGVSRQPIQIHLEHAGTPTEAVTRLDGRVVDKRTLDRGKHTFQILTDAVSSPTSMAVVVSIGGVENSASITLQPVRKALIYVLPHSHHDLGYTDLQADVEEKQMQNITLGMDLAEKTSTYPAGARFVWNLEVLWGADFFCRRRPQAEVERFIEAVKKGWVSINGMYANELTGLCRPEELLQLFRFGKELGTRCGVPVDSAMLSDVPGFTWGTITAMAQAGIRYFSVAPNYFDRIGSLMIEWQDKPFWATSPSGKDKVLVWIPWTGYAMSHINKLGPAWVGAYQDRLDTVNFPYDISHIRWSGHGDNAAPDPELSEFVKGWNETYEWPRFEISSTGKAFAAFEAKHGAEIPVKHGDLTPYWEDGAGSSALETAMSRVAADRLVQVQAFDAMYPGSKIDPAQMHEAWRDVLLYSEHTWGAWCSVSDSESTFTQQQWAYKRAFAVSADKRSKDLLALTLPGLEAKTPVAVIDIHNSTSWTRSELVLIPAALSSGRDRVHDNRGRSMASQRLKSGELALQAMDVPAFGSARFHLSASSAHEPKHAVSYREGVLDNGILRVKIDPTSGDLTELTVSGNAANLIDHQPHQAANQYLFLQGSDVSQLQNSGGTTITVDEEGPLLLSVRVESVAPGCKSLTRTVRLAAGWDHVELVNRVDKQRAALNPTPGKGGQGDAFAQRGSKESVQFGFPFAVPDGVMRVDVPYAVMRPGLDQLPGACKNWLPVGRWVDVSNKERGVTWATLDAPLIEVGGITANMLGSQRDPNAWRQAIAPTQRFYSWVMNNHWGTNYRAYQEGVVTFRYAMRPHAGYDAAMASRFAIGLSQPLLPTAAGAGPARPPLLHVEPQDVICTLKSTEDGQGKVLRLFGASGETRHASIKWQTTKTPACWISDLQEARVSRLPERVEVLGWELISVRADVAT